MQVTILPNPEDLGRAASIAAAESIRAAITARGKATIIVATGASQFATLDQLTRAVDIDWSCVDCFHLDEYVGLTESHPASFRRYLRTRFIEKLPIQLSSFTFINGEGDCVAECERLGALIEHHDIDVALIGIGENGHLAFNDPPADFETETPFLIVDLDLACRKQQLSEEWFPDLDSVPKRAISMSIRQILKSELIICSVPDERKAAAVAEAIQGSVTPNCPASILQSHHNTWLYLDPPAATRLSPHQLP